MTATTGTPSMRPESAERDGPLRQGLTTGSCATAAAVAAARRLLTGEAPRSVAIRLPRGQHRKLAIEDLQTADGAATAGVIKDAGDDPDATHGARVWVEVALSDQPGVGFHAGAGVGTVTRSGLMLAVGEPAINPVPRRMMAEHLDALAAECAYTGGFEVTVGVDDGERIARRTMNARLGIVGGLSILGTTGIVRPFSCAAFVASIHQAVDVARANGTAHVAGCTGGTSEQLMRELHGLEDSALIEMGDLFGALLKYLRRHPLPRLTLAAGFGKLSKFAAGQLDTHSRKCAIDFDFLTREAAALGAPPALQSELRASNTSVELLQRCRQAGLALGQRLAERGLAEARRHLPADMRVAVCACDRNGHLVGHAEHTP